MRPLLAVLFVVLLGLSAWAVSSSEPAALSGEAQIASESLLPRQEAPPRIRAVDAANTSRAQVETKAVIEYQIVDAETGEGLPQAGIFKVTTSGRVAECDDAGIASSTELDPAQLYFYAEGYLLGYFRADTEQLETLRAQVETGQVRVPLYRDILSFSLHLDAVLPDGRLAEEARFQLIFEGFEERGEFFAQQLSGCSPGLRRAWENYRHAPWNTAELVTGFRLASPRYKLPLSRPHVRLFATGKYRIYALLEGGFYGEARQWVYPDTGRIQIDLSADAPFKGRVLDSRTGGPVAGVQVNLEPAPKRSWLGEDTTGEGGTFALYAMGPRPRLLEFKHPLFETKFVRSIEPGASLDVVLTRRPPVIMSGVVRTRGSGKPIAGAEFLVYHHSKGPAMWPEEGTKLDELCTVSDRHGRFKIHGLPEGQRGSLSVHITAEGYLEEDRWFLMVDGNRFDPQMTPDTIEKRVEAGITSVLSGRVLHPEGKPAPHVDLRLSVDGVYMGRPLPGFPGTWQGSFQVLSDLPGGFDVHSLSYSTGFARTDSSGGFAFECAVPGLAQIMPLDESEALTTVPIRLGRVYRDLQIHIK